MDFSLIWEKLIDSIELCWVIVRGFRRFEFGVDYISVVVCTMLKNKNENGISNENRLSNENRISIGKEKKKKNKNGNKKWFMKVQGKLKEINSKLTMKQKKIIIENVMQIIQ